MERMNRIWFLVEVCLDGGLVSDGVARSLQTKVCVTRVCSGKQECLICNGGA
jgi:hypothetical protein